MSRNDITGDRIATRPSSEYERNFDRIFRRPGPSETKPLRPKEPSPTTDPAFAEFLQERGILETLYGDDV